MSRSCPIASDLVSATPWKSGVNQARARTGSGSCSIGKNVPLNRKSGVMMKRKTNAKDCSVLRDAVQAAIGMPNATPVRIAAGQARRTVGEFTAPNRNATVRKTPVTIPTRTMSQYRWPITMSRTPCGVPTIASNVLFHLNPANNGQDDSCVAVCIAWDASRPGARKTR